jgi:intracellular sulfur oxidation DsrE/DsrF family protein
MNSSVSDEKLCAFIDGELDSAERQDLLHRLQMDNDLRDRVCAFRITDDMIRMAYTEVPQGRTRSARPGAAAKMTYGALAAAVLLALGLSGGWVLRGQAVDDAAPGGLLGFLPKNVQPAHLAEHPDARKVLLHIDSSDPVRVRRAFDYANAFLKAAHSTGVTVHLETVANFKGIDVLRSGMTPYSDRFRALARRGAGVELVACGNAVARLRSMGENPDLVPGVRVAPSAVAEIVTRLEDGWTYIKV